MIPKTIAGFEELLFESLNSGATPRLIVRMTVENTFNLLNAIEDDKELVTLIRSTKNLVKPTDVRIYYKQTTK